MVQFLAISAKEAMEHHGLVFGASTLTVKTKAPKGSIASFVFPTVLLAQGFFDLFYDYHWDSEDGAYTCVLKLTNKQFEQERRLKAGPNRQPCASVKVYSSGGALVPPPGLPSIPTPARATN